MKALVIGASGQLGTDVCKALQGFDVIPLIHSDIEIGDMNSVRQAFNKHRPNIIINTAAYIRVDDCESNQDKAFLVNALGARNVAVGTQELGAKLIHISTDYVFGGLNEALSVSPNSKGGNHFYTEFDTPLPLNVYGKSKLEGENFIRHLCLRYFIIRTSGLFGTVGASGKGGNFVETIRKLAQDKPEIKVVGDQVFSPTYTKDLAEKIARLVNTEYYGTFHITNRGYCSWYAFAEEILRLAGSKTPVVRITSDEYPQKAKRPKFSVLDDYHLRLLGIDDMRTWQKALEEYMGEKAHLK